MLSKEECQVNSYFGDIFKLSMFGCASSASGNFGRVRNLNSVMVQDAYDFH